MKNRSLFLAEPVETTRAVRTGEHCPQSGWWVPLGSGSDGADARFIGEGSVMPAVGAGPALWVPRSNR
ncbi:hypothetical protein ACFVTE_03220 [Arthrobacter sp. NPDC058097]|uniref:hypothetical protein n=1 Tax=Arthrobacter sp. NPDC058097 TaxID=3346340 RepID=UPI0036D9E93F